MTIVIPPIASADAGTWGGTAGFGGNTDIGVSLGDAKVTSVKTFILIFHGYDDLSPEFVAAWDGWAQRRAAHFADVGHRFGPGRQITNETTIEWSLSSSPASGYAIVVAPHIDAAEQLLEGCPIVESVSLYEAVPRPAPAVNQLEQLDRVAAANRCSPNQEREESI